MSRTRRLCAIAIFSLGMLAWSAGGAPLLAQTITVTSATPPAAPQGTINLNVIVAGSGFSKGAQANWYLTGTTNPAGVTVNSTTFKNSSQLTANVTVSDTASTASFDIVVKSSGRTGKGVGTFAVTQKGTPVGCTTLGTPSGFTQITTLNYVNASGAPQYGPGLGINVRVRPVVLTAGSQSRTVLVAAVGAPLSTGKLEIFILDPATGQVLDGTVIVGTQVQPHITVVTNAGAKALEPGDVDANGVPDFVVADGTSVRVILGSQNPTTGILSYGPAIAIQPPANSPGFGPAVGMGKLDGTPGDNVIVGAPGAGSGGNAKAGMVFIYEFNGSLSSPGFNLVGTVNDPLPNTKKDDGFGGSVGTGRVTGSGGTSLIVGAPNASVNGTSGSGRVFVFPAPLSSPAAYYALTAPAANGSGLGAHVGAGTLTTSTATDVIATTGSNVSIFGGPITSNRTTSSSTFLPYPGLNEGLVNHIDIGEINGDAWTEVLVGAPNANSSPSCNFGPGSAQLYLSNPFSTSGPQYTLNLFQTQIFQSDFMGFGYGVAAVPDVPGLTGYTPLILVGENGRDLGGVTSAGQVYVYKQQ